ncbi:FadR/GntR family transcriptional regulator [Phytohabitans rumicis]|uniref:FadR/GntR family transcriptional regulator n=1 Tax=Phytohabitans rumicis TaxID=1076125 RepID=UPI001565D017|nr:FCD domain-containing protein [Phytohabitans rumicis]
MTTSPGTPGDGARDTATPAPATAYQPGYVLAAERLLEYIAEQQLRPGDRLPTERGLAEILQTGRTVTREAVKVLAAVGRISVRKGAGLFVAAPANPIAGRRIAYFQPTDLVQVRMMFEYRRLIEADSARRAANLATPIQVRAVREAAEGTMAVWAEADPSEFARFDALFHDAVAVAAGNVFLEAAVSDIRDFAAQSDRLLFLGELPGSLEVAAHQHLAIAAAIAEGRPDAAAAAMIEHVDTTQAQFEERIHNRLLKADPTPDAG